MKKIIALILTVCIALTGCSQTPSTPVSKTVTRQSDIAVIYTNDVHCGLDDSIGYAGVAAFKKELQNEGNQVLLVDAGDAIQGAPIGSMTNGSAVVDIMNYVGYDAAVPGNHEFDYGMDNFKEIIKSAKFSYVCSNIMDLTENKPLLPAYIIKEVDGVKIAFVGADTPKTITSSTPAFFQNDKGEYIYGFCQEDNGSKLYENIQNSVDAAKKEGADYVFILSHLGIDGSDAPFMSTDLIANTNGIDVVIDGHSHSILECERVKNKDGKRVLLTSTGTKLNTMGLLYLSKEGNITTGLISNYENKDAETTKFIDEQKGKFDEILNTVVAKSDVDLYINDPKTETRIVRSAETNMGDFCADAYRYMVDAQIGFANGGGVRCDLPAGDLTNGDILTVNPFGNNISLVEATGAEILDALEMGARAVPEETGAFLQVSGLTYEIHTYIPSSVKLDKNGMFEGVEGEYRVRNVMVGDEPLDPEKTYTVASHDYLLKQCGDGMTMFADNNVLKDGVMLDSEVLIKYVAEKLDGVIGDDYKNPYGAGRIVAVESAK